MTFPTDLPESTDYRLAVWTMLAILVLVMAPGLGLNAARPGRTGPLPSALVPLPGCALLAGAGLILWSTRGVGAAVLVAVLIATTSLATLTVAWRCWREGRVPAVFGEQGAAPFVLWLCVAGTAFSIGVNPLPVAQEYPAGDILPGRMVASPPDHTIPYMTAAYMFHGGDGRAGSDDYFGEGWSIGSRGPLVPLAVSALFRVFKAQPSDPPNFDRTKWPVTREGAFLARAFGWLANGFVVLGVGHLLFRLEGRRGAAWRVGLAWAALAPATLINTVFLWPKLLATFFLLLSTASVLEGGAAVAGLWAALAWLSHPVGALFLPGLGAMVVWRSADPPARWRARATASPALPKAMAMPYAAPWRARATASLRFGLALAAVLAPWQAYKLWLGQHDAFLDYLLAAGDTARAASFDAWLAVRTGNAVTTLVPGYFVLDGDMTGWLYGPLTDALRWTVQYAKTLPSELGFSLFWAAYAALPRFHRDRRLLALSLCGVIANFAVMLVFWGYSADGLGRNCLEPLIYMAIVVAAAGIRPPPLVWALGAVGLFLEGRWIELSGFVGAEGFRWEHVPVAAVIACATSTGLQGAVAAWAWRSRHKSVGES